MSHLPDADLLEQFAQHNSENAFRVLVERHLALVHSVALRHTASPEQAQDITQAVFIILARKARSLGRKTVLPGWLYHTARLTAANFRRSEQRRIGREQEAFMQSGLETTTADDVWREVSPLLDDAMGRLGTTDRDAIVLRYFENKSLPEMGRALGLAERTAQKRVGRAIEKLRRFFTKSGVTLSAAAVCGVLAANSVQVARVGLAATVCGRAIKGSGVAASTLTLVKGTMNIMAWIKLKMALGLGTAMLLVGGVTMVALSERNNPPGTGNSLAVESVVESPEDYVITSDDSSEKNFAGLSVGASATSSPSTPQSEAELSAVEIIRKTQAQYAALSSYRSTGTITSELAGVTSTTAFTIHLAQPDFYRVEWASMNSAPMGQGVVWSAGEGDFLQIGNAKSEKQRDKATALAGATGISGGATANIPGTFFNLNWGNSLKPLIPGKKLKDESVGDVACYVLTNKVGDDGTITIWVGKQDFFIHQIRQTRLVEPSLTDSQISEFLAGANLPDTPRARAEVRKEIAREQARERSNKIRSLAKTGKSNGAGPESNAIPTTGRLVRVTIQTHENITVNQEFSAIDFVP